MTKNRIEAFSDAIIAIILTIMVLEMKVPHDASLGALVNLLPVFLSYVLSFAYVGIYWNNHHHLFHAVRHVDGAVLWANLHLIFWLSLLPFVTGWMGENHFESSPVLLYGFVLLMCAVAYRLLVHSLVCKNHNPDLATAIGKDFKGNISALFYLVGIFMAFIHPWIGIALYAFVALLWLVPDRRIERKVSPYEDH